MKNSLLRKISRPLIYFLENNRLFLFYTHQQVYRFKYSVTLTNNSSLAKNFYLILPIPSNCESQKLKSEIKTNPISGGIFQDSLYENKYTFWQIDLGNHEVKKFEEEFTIEVSPASPSIKKHHFTLKDYLKCDPDLYSLYTSPNNFVSGEDAAIKSFALDIKKNTTDVFKIAQKINEFVISFLEYKNPILDLYSYKQALKTRQVDCGGFDALFVSLCQACGIPARVVSGFLAGYKNNSMHAWAEFMLPNGVWVPVDPSMEQLFGLGKTKKSGRFGYVGSDRVIFSYGCDMPLIVDDLKIRAPILQNPIIVPAAASKEIQMEIQCLTENVHE
ncbi:MAG: transglutaminase domain-containing protein [Candidatus Gracilibacteria bacterium]|jgi:hypothetical protein